MEILDLVNSQFANNKNSTASSTENQLKDTRENKKNKKAGIKNNSKPEKDELPWEAAFLDTQNNTPNKQKPSTKRIAIFGLIILTIIVCSYGLVNYFSNVTSTSVNTQESSANSPDGYKISVHVTGAVVNPGVYKLEQGARIIDAVNAAGGFAANAKQDSNNLAKVLEDGEQIVVSSTDSASSNAAGNNANGSGSSSSQSSSGSQSGTSANNGKVNINTADATQLQTLNGIGPSTAQKIIDYRNANGAFKKIEDIKNVSGIGDKTFAKFSDKICV